MRRRAELGRGEEWNLTLARSGKLRTERWKSWMACAPRRAYARPSNGNVSKDKVGDDAESLSPRSCEMIAAPPSSSDGTGAVSFDGVEAPPPGRRRGRGRRHWQRRKCEGNPSARIILGSSESSKA